MGVNEQKDLRVKKTMTAIREAFTEMLLEMPYERITVTELSKRASINKKTFYRHYPVLDDLLREMQLSYATPFVQRTSGLRYPEDVDAITREFLIYSAQQGELYDAVVTSGMHEEILAGLLEDMGKERLSGCEPPEGWSEKEWSLYVSHVNYSQVHYYKQWVHDGRAVPVNRMVALGVRLISNGALSDSARSFN